jgi:hypothetical protein
MIERFRKINKWKERFLRAGWICQLGGLILSAAAVRGPSRQPLTGAEDLPVRQPSSSDPDTQ